MEPKTRKTSCNPLLMNFNEPRCIESDSSMFNFYYDPIHQIAYYMGGGGSSSGSSRGGRNTETKKGGKRTDKVNYRDSQGTPRGVSTSYDDDARYYMDD